MASVTSWSVYKSQAYSTGKPGVTPGCKGWAGEIVIAFDVIYLCSICVYQVYLHKNVPTYIANPEEKCDYCFSTPSSQVMC